MTSRGPIRSVKQDLPDAGGGRVELRRSAPAGQRPDSEAPDIGYVFDTDTRELIGVYGSNPTEDYIWFSLEVKGSSPIRLGLPPGTRAKQAVHLTSPAPTRTITKPITVRRAMVEQAEVLPIERVVVERIFTNPVRNSPVVLSVTATEVTSGTSHNIAMPSTVDAGDLLLNVLTWNGDGDATSNGVPSGWAEDGQVDDAPFGYVAALVKDAVGDEDGTNVNFTTSPAAPVIAHVYRIEAGSWDDSSTAAAAVQIGGSATGNSSNPNPGSLSPSWGSAANLWIAVGQTTGDITFSAVPSGYTDAGQNQFDAADGELALNTAYRTNEASSEDPAAFTMSESFFWLAALIAVKPSAGGTNYDDTGRVISIASTIASTDSRSGTEAPAVAASATVAGTDQAAHADAPAVSATSTAAAESTQAGIESPALTAATTVAVGDDLTLTEALDVTAATTVAGTDQAELVDTAAISIDSTVDVADGRAIGESVAVAVTSEVDATDDLTLTEAFEVTAATTVAGTDQADYIDDSAVTSAAVIDLSDARDSTEALAVDITATVAVDDAATGTEAAHTTITSTAGVDDTLNAAPIDYDDTGRQIDITATFVAIEGLRFTDEPAVAIAATVTGLDQTAGDDTSLDVEANTEISIADQADLNDHSDLDVVGTVTATSGHGTSDTVTVAIDTTVTVTDQVFTFGGSIEAAGTTVGQVEAGQLSGGLVTSRQGLPAAVTAGGTTVEA